MKNIIETVKSFIAANGLIPGKMEWKGLVALSGGADSVCLLMICKRLNLNVEAVHCNFRLRGEESDRDEKFCEGLCEREGVPFHRVHFDTRTYAELHGVSIEMAARELRYDYFEQLRRSIQADAILVAHHRDDSVETVLMNLVRGTGIHGLQGIKPKNGNILRPLLCVGRKDIEEWLHTLGQDYVTDSTNLEDDVVRNKIRLNVIPLLQEINPSVSDNISLTASRVAEAVKVFDDAIRSDVAGVVASNLEDESTPPSDRLLRIDMKALSSVSSREYTLFTILSPLRFTPAQVEDIASNDCRCAGKRWESAGYVLAVDRDCLLVRKKTESLSRSLVIPETGNYVISETENSAERLSVKEIVVGEGDVIDKSPACATLDAAKVKFPLRLRRVRQGDRFMPFGMKGTKLVSDYLTDRKRTVFQKEAQWVLADKDDAIVWLVGERPDGRYCVDGKTIKALVIRYKK